MPDLSTLKIESVPFVPDTVDTSDLHRVIQGREEENCIAAHIDPRKIIPTPLFRDALIKFGLVEIQVAEQLFSRFQSHCPDTNIYDAVQHILVGDRAGGGHHPSTAIALGYPMLIASGIKNTNLIPKKLAVKNRRRNNFTDSSGAFAAGHSQVVYAKPDGTAAFRQSRLYGLSAFPHSWSTQELLEAIIGVAEHPESITTLSVDGTSLTLSGIYKSTRVQTIVSLETGKILTAHPIVNQDERP